jgi:hemoglobin
MRTQSWRWRGVATVWFFLAWAGGLKAADDAGKLDRGNYDSLKSGIDASDRQIYDSLKTVINAGADLFNKDFDKAGCYRLYQGSLLTIQPLLSRRPELQKEIAAALDDADRQPSYAARAWALRKALDRVRAELRPAPAAVAPEGKMPPVADRPGTPPEKRPVPEKKPPVPATLWTRLGGGTTVRKVVDDWVALAAADPKVNFSRGGKIKLTDAQVADLKDKLVAFMSQATGGPIAYSGKSMKEAHKDMGITNAEFDVAVVDLKKALEGHGVKPAEAQDLITIVEGTRNDIVEVKGAPEKKPDENKPAAKKPGEGKSGL